MADQITAFFLVTAMAWLHINGPYEKMGWGLILYTVYTSKVNNPTLQKENRQERQKMSKTW